MSSIKKHQEKLFEEIKHINEYGEEFWYARELQKALDYSEWRNFKIVIEKAIEACSNSENEISNHFVEANKMVRIGSESEKTCDSQ